MDSTSGTSNPLKAWVFIVQDYSLLALHSVQNIFADKRYFAELIEQMDVIGVGSLKIVVVALICVGGSIVLNAASQFSRFGETALTADAVSLGLLRELGPVFTALLVAGRNATAMASELGSMVVTEQVDAIRVFRHGPNSQADDAPCVCDGVSAAVARRSRGLCGTFRRFLGRKYYTAH